MPWVDGLAEQARRVPPLLVLAGLAVLQLLVLAGLERNGGWTFSTGDAVLGAALVTAELVLVWAVGRTIGGELAGAIAGLAWVVAPAVLTRYFIVGGAALTDFGGVFHMKVLPYAYGFTAPESVAAGALLLASAWLALSPAARSLGGDAGSGAAAGAAVGAAALFHPFVWPAVAAPALALAVARRPRAALAAAVAAALLGLVALALFRSVPGIHPGWHQAGQTLDLFREYSWSRRILEYLPLAGLVGLGIRNRPAAMFFGWVLLTVIVFTLGREHSDLLALMLALVPGYGVYAVLLGSIVLLVPSRRPAEAPAPAVTAEPTPR